MNFQNNLEEFTFNLETLDFMKTQNLSETEIVESLSQANFSEELTKLVLKTNRSFLNSVLLRLKLYSKFNYDQVNEKLNKYNMQPLIQKLFVEEQVVEQVVESNEEHVEEQVEEPVEEPVIELQEDDDENYFNTFYQKYITKTSNKKDTIKSKEVYSVYREWYTNEYSENVPSKSDLKNFLNQKLGKSSKNTWTSVTLNN